MGATTLLPYDSCTPGMQPPPQILREEPVQKGKKLQYKNPKNNKPTVQFEAYQ
jgi:hypothetical protein